MFSNPDTLPSPAEAPVAGSSPAKRAFRLPEATALIVFLLLEVVAFSLLSEYFFSWTNFVNILTAVSVSGILAAGATILLVAGQFDLSVGSGVAFVGLMVAILAPPLGLPAAIMLAVLAGIAIGAINGFLVTVVKVNALITTLGTMAIFRGLTVSIGKGQNIPVPDFDWAIMRLFLGIPMPVLIFALVAVTVAVLMRNTTFGRSIYAIGANESAARLVGIQTGRTIFVGFLISGACIALAGLVNTSLLGSTSGTTGLGLEMAVVTAVILGGTSLKGGIGSVTGTVLGLVIVGVMSNGLTLLNVASSWQDVASGCLLILAVSLDQFRQRLAVRR